MQIHKNKYQMIWRRNRHENLFRIFNLYPLKIESQSQHSKNHSFIIRRDLSLAVLILIKTLALDALLIRENLFNFLHFQTSDSLNWVKFWLKYFDFLTGLKTTLSLSNLSNFYSLDLPYQV